MVYTMEGGTGGSLSLRIVRSDYDVSKTVAYGCSAVDFNTSIGGFNSFSFYQRDTILKMYDSGGSLTTDSNQATKYEYHVSFFKLRPQNYQDERFIMTPIGYDGTFTQVQLTPHSPLIGGSFSIEVAGVNLKNGYVPYDTPEATLEEYFRTVPGFERVTVDRRSINGYLYDSTWIISYKWYYANRPTLNVGYSNLKGGKTQATAINTILRSHSTNIIFDPIDHRHLRTSAPKHAVTVSVNSIQAVCLADCTYDFKDRFAISSLSVSGSQLSLAITNPLNININFSDIRVRAEGQNCIISSSQVSTILNINCQLPTNADGTPILPAGNFVPEVYINSFGYVGLGSGVSH